MYRFVLLAALIFAFAPAANGATAWDESVNGDLSNNYLAPTPLSFVLGSNHVIGTTFRSPSTNLIDYDIFTFTVAPGSVLSAVVVTSVSISSTFSFFGITNGSALAVNPDTVNSTQNATGLLGWTHYTNGDAGMNILPRIGTGPGATGFTPPLGAGPYSVWLQETSSLPTNYNFDFQISAAAAIPEPEAYALLVAGLALLGFAGRRQQNPLARLAL
jgi:hypothetical protein